MGYEWQEISLAELADINPSRAIKKGEEKPFIDMASLPTHGRDVDKKAIASRIFNGSGSRFMDGDTLIARITPCLENGKTVLVSGLGEGVIAHGSTEFIVIASKNGKADSGFLYYLARSPVFREYAIQHMEGTSGRQRVPNVAVANFRFLCPSLEERRQIASILSSLDDRISLFRETNATLESIAQSIFKSWFVNFDPVKAKAEGRDPEGMDAETAELFPSEFEESELGLIPKGWRVRPFSNTVQVMGGGTPKTSIPEYWDGDIPWFSVVDAPEESDIFVIDTEKKITTSGLKNSSTRILPEGTTIISARGTVGKVAMTGVSMAMNQSCYGLCGEDTGSTFTYYATRNLVSVLKQHSHGAVFDTITRNTLSGVSIVVPPTAICHLFQAEADPLMQRIKTNLHTMKTLASLRDTMLPRLMSGKLRVPEAEMMIEEAKP